jgi:pimeloyl-ACP methyl ester carboxylesterase
MRYLLVVLTISTALGQTPKVVPPPGVAIPAEAKAGLEAKLAELNGQIAKLGKNPLLPDVLVFREAVRIALEYNEFFKADEAAKAQRVLDEGLLRASQLLNKQAPWTTATGTIVRGYVSKIDGSIQPYGLVIPAGWRATDAAPWRLDTWFHGRSETLSELNFVFDRMSKPGEFAPPDAIMIHLYGRYCNANKFAGEVDLFEALEATKRHYRIDENRIFARGFSMGGAASWHIGAHHAGLWAAVAPGAGFAETAVYQNFASKGIVKPWYEQKLWRLYDATGYAANFFQTPLIAYSGEKDKQMQAALIMAENLRKEGLELAHVIGPDTEHKYHPASKIDIEKRLAAIAKDGRDPYPASLRFSTYTLRYNRMRWLVLDGLEEHWEPARVKADVSDKGDVSIEATNVSAFSVDFGPGGWKHAPDHQPMVRINGQVVKANKPQTDRSWKASFVKTGNTWALRDPAAAPALAKANGLQGPIDDAFMDSFLMVLPTGESASPLVKKWTQAESTQAIQQWRAQFRGEARVKKDSEVTAEDIANSNLVVWGDPASNSLLARLLPQLPLTWNASTLAIGKESCQAASCLPVMIYPNPLNPKRYIVLNSGPTMRADSWPSNSLQTPRLPDVALVDLNEAPGPSRPGKILWADFFNEQWQLKAKPAPRLP